MTPNTVVLDGAGKPEVVSLGDQYKEDDLLFHDETDEGLAFMLSRMAHPEFPEPMGVFYRIPDECYENLLDGQVAAAVEARGRGDLKKLLHGGDTWTVKPPGEVGQQSAGLHE